MLKNDPSTSRTRKRVVTPNADKMKKNFLAQNVEKTLKYQVYVTFVSRDI